MWNQLSSSGSTGKLVLVGIGAVALACKLGFLECSNRETKEVNIRSNDSPQEEELLFIGICVLALIFVGIFKVVRLILKSSELIYKQLSNCQLLRSQSQRTSVSSDEDSTDSSDDDSQPPACDSGSFSQRKLKIMTYNLCHPKKNSLHARMTAVTLLVREHMPDVVLFQEATSEIHEILMCFQVWHSYQCIAGRRNCMVFSKLPMNSMHLVSFTEGGELLLTNTDICNGKDLIVATTHLKCSRMNSKEDLEHQQKRMSQAKEAIKTLNHYQNIVFGGDMNWKNTDDCFPLESGWIDAWEYLMPHNPGYTFDTETNPLLKGRKVSRQRFDRFLCKLNSFELMDIKIIGTKVIPVFVPFNYAAKPGWELVNISDHYGLILMLRVVE